LGDAAQAEAEFETASTIDASVSPRKAGRRLCRSNDSPIAHFAATKALNTVNVKQKKHLLLPMTAVYHQFF
jgi:hypothetical protein